MSAFWSASTPKLQMNRQQNILSLLCQSNQWLTFLKMARSMSHLASKSVLYHISLNMPVLFWNCYFIICRIDLMGAHKCNLDMTYAYLFMLPHLRSYSRTSNQLFSEYSQSPIFLECQTYFLPAQHISGKSYLVSLPLGFSYYPYKSSSLLWYLIFIHI